MPTEIEIASDFAVNQLTVAAMDLAGLMRNPEARPLVTALAPQLAEVHSLLGSILAELRDNMRRAA